MNTRARRQLRLALVAERLDALAGGAEHSTLEMAQGLMRRGHEVTLLVGRCPADFTVPGATVVRWQKRGLRGGWNLLRFSRWAGRQLREGGYDASLSFATSVPATLVEPWGGTVRETLDRNIAMRTHVLGRAWKRLRLSVILKQQMFLHLERKTMADPSVRRLVALSEYVAGQFRRHYGVADQRIEVVPNAVRLSDLTEDQRAQCRRRVREGFGIDDAATVYLFAAMNPKLKGVVPLLKASRELMRRGERFVVMLAGKIGYGEQALAAELGVREQVRVVGATRDMASLYCAADVTVLPSYYDPASRVIIESLTFGTPGITTAFNGSGDLLVRPGRRCGEVVADPGDYMALAAAMHRLADPGERQRCSVVAWADRELFSMERHVDRVEALLLEHAAPGSEGAGIPAGSGRHGRGENGPA